VAAWRPPDSLRTQAEAEHVAAVADAAGQFVALIPAAAMPAAAARGLPK
jgi:hypothetical protein